MKRLFSDDNLGIMKNLFKYDTLTEIINYYVISE